MSPVILFSTPSLQPTFRISRPRFLGILGRLTGEDLGLMWQKNAVARSAFGPPCQLSRQTQ